MSHAARWGRKGASCTPTSADTGAGDCRRHRRPKLPCLGFPFARIRAPPRGCALGQGSPEGRGPPVCGGAEAEAQRSDGRGGAEGALAAPRPPVSSGVSPAPYQARPGGQALICGGPASSGRCAGGERRKPGRRGRGEGGPGPGAAHLPSGDPRARRGRPGPTPGPNGAAWSALAPTWPAETRNLARRTQSQALTRLRDQRWGKRGVRLKIEGPPPAFLRSFIHPFIHQWGPSQ